MPTAVKMARKVLGLPPTPAQEPASPKGFEYAKAPSARAAKWTRIGWRSLVILGVLLLGVLVIQNIKAINRAAFSAPSTAALNPDAARTAAATFTGDYLFHDPLAAPTAGQDVLRRDLAPGGDPARLSFAGIGYLSADLVIPGAVTPVDATHAVVTVQARVTIGMPGNADAASPPVASAAAAAATTAAAVPGRTANAAVLPAGYQVVTTQWLPVQVPVVQTDSGVLVDVNGPVFSADPPPAPAVSVIETDSSATAETTGWVKTLFTSYALGSTSGAYLSAPGVNLGGLAGAVTVTDIQSWSLSNPGPDGLRRGTAKVGWAVTGADLTATQQYSVTVQTSDNRWYATALGTSTTPPSN
jgi:hypothetical protein